QDDQRRQLKEEWHNAAVLHQQGIPFALSGHGLEKPEKFRENLRKVIAEGLPPEAALKALTVDAARLLGVEKLLGTIAPGKAAHLVVTDGDFHEAKTQVCYVFVDGVRFEYAKPGVPPKEAEAKKPEAGKAAEPNKEDPTKPAASPPKEQATEIEADRKPKLHTGGNLLIRGATVLTV